MTTTFFNLTKPAYCLSLSSHFFPSKDDVVTAVVNATTNDKDTSFTIFLL